MTRAVIVLGTAAIVLALAPGARGATAADAVAWWQVSPVAGLTRIDAAEGQVVVQGGGPEDHHAVGGLSFPVPNAIADASLSVPVVSATPGAMIAACVVTEPFRPAAGGPAEDVPAHDCTTRVVGTVSEDGATIDLERIGSFARDGHLRLLLVPHTGGRVVLDGVAASLAATAPSAPAPALTTQETTAPTSASTGATAPATAALPPAPVTAPQAAVAAPSPSPVASLDGATRPLTVPAFERRDDAGSRARTAAVLGAILAAFVLVQRGGATRLRPATVPWRRHTH